MVRCVYDFLFLNNAIFYIQNKHIYGKMIICYNSLTNTHAFKCMCVYSVSVYVQHTYNLFAVCIYKYNSMRWHNISVLRYFTFVRYVPAAPIPPRCRFRNVKHLHV